MGNVVAARRLRKSLINNTQLKYNNPFEELEKKKYISDEYEEKDVEDTKRKFKIKYKTKLLIKVFLSILIVFSCLIGKLVIPDTIKNNRFVGRIITEYNKDYSKEYLFFKLENFTKNIYPKIEFVIPENLSMKIKDKYNVIKPKIIAFELKKEFISFIYNNQAIETISKNDIFENSTQEEIKEVFNNLESIENVELKNQSSAVSMMQDDVATVLSKNISIAIPVNGTITSEYGAREQIFSDVNPYHTGIDIANVTGTEIKSATDGVVYKTQSMDKYYGNNIEIEKDGIIFKYAHLSEIKVKEGDEIKQGDIIGLMGDTGYTTGPHLHFEIIVDSRTINPRNLVDF